MKRGKAQRTLVLGGGHNGLVCASLLARSGLSVTVIEAAPTFGGAASTYQFTCGCQISRAANSISLLDIDVVRLIGNYNKELPAFTVPDPQLVVFSGSSPITLRPLSAEALAADLSRQTQEPIEALLLFFSDLSAAAAAVAHLWTDPYASRERFMDALAAVDSRYKARFLENSIHSTVSEYFSSSGLQLVLGSLNSIVPVPITEPETSFCLLYLGSGNLGFSPNYALVQSGMGHLARLLEDTARATGVSLNANEAALAINIADGAVSSVSTSQRREISADLYVSAFGPIPTSRLMSPAGKHQHLKIGAHETACAKLNCLAPRDLACRLLRRDGRPTAKVVFCGSIEDLESAARDAQRGVPTTNPFIELMAPSLIGAESSCPCHIPLSLYALYFPYEWCASVGEKDAEETIKDRVLASLSRWLPELSSELEIVDINTPLSIERQFNMWHGDVDHGSFLDGNILDSRGYGLLPHGRTDLPNLFNCSAGIHPGGLVSGRPAITCAKTILEMVERG